VYFGAMIDLPVFHKNLLGFNPDMTPPEFLLTKTHERLYVANRESARCGYLLPSSGSRESWEHLLGTFILAYGQTPEGNVTFAVSPPAQRWADEQLRKIARRIFRSRAGAAKSSLEGLYKNFQRLNMGSSVLQIPEPPRWVAYGFTDTDVLPPWMRNRLVSVGTT
jgi:hypothetical protein